MTDVSDMPIEEVEIDLLVEGVRRRYGMDFGQYARPSLRRRIRKRMFESKASSVSDLLARLLHDEEQFELFLTDMSVTVTEMFRDPPFFRAVREHVVPHLKNISTPKIWHAGCATGEEVYSMAIVLQEEECLEHCRIYGTDYNNRSLAIARDAMFPMARMRMFAGNYYASGGTSDFADYYRSRYGRARLSGSLRKRVSFSHHNLVQDGSPGDIDVIVCRNVLIYFNKDLQHCVFESFASSLNEGGLLCLGSKESVLADYKKRFDPVSSVARLFKLSATMSSDGCEEAGR